MKNIGLISLFVLLLAITSLIFLFSCVVTLSDGQGALIFILSIPIMALLIALSWFLAHVIDKSQKFKFRLKWMPKAFSFLLIVFFISFFTPALKMIPHTFLGIIGKSFESFTGKTPYAYFKERNSFSNLLSRDIGDSTQKQIDFSTLGGSFAWDKVCIFGPYTNNSKARSITKLDWNIEDRSKIQQSDSINALVFLFEGKVNHLNPQIGTAGIPEEGCRLKSSEEFFSICRSPSG